MDVSSTVLFYGPAAMGWLADDSSPQELQTALGGDAALAQDLSPLSHVHAGIAPVLLMHGGADSLVSARESEVLHEALHVAGVDSTLEITPGAEHCFIGTPIEPHLDRAIAFLSSHLLGEPRPVGSAQS